MRYLGIDYGLRKIGLAISEGKVASPLGVIKVSGLRDTVSKLERIIKDENISEVILGLPDSGEVLSGIKSFKKILGKKIKVHLADETLTTQSAQKFLISQNASKRKRKEKLDSISACIILQNFLDLNEAK